MTPVDDTLLQRYEVVSFRIISSSQISDRATTIISRLTAERQDGEKPVIVSLTAQAKVASKLISIIEIAKRELASKSIRCFQYNALSSQMIEVPRTNLRKANGDSHQVAQDHAGTDSDDAFETMGASPDSMKKRNVPVMTVFLAGMSVKELRAEYGSVTSKIAYSSDAQHAN